MKISVITPMYNEEAGARRFFENVVPFLEKTYKHWELIIINDGSTDATMDIINEFSIKNNKIKVFVHKKNVGIGAGLKTGLKNATGDVIITMDSDLTYSPSDIPKLIKRLEETGADMIIGTSFFIKGSDHSEAPFIGSVMSIVANFLDRIIFRLNFTTPTCFFRAWRKDLAKNIKIYFDGFESIPESAITAHKMGYKVTEAPLKYTRVEGRKTKQKYLKDTRKHIEMIIRLLRLYRGGKYKDSIRSRH